MKNVNAEKKYCGDVTIWTYPLPPVTIGHHFRVPPFPLPRWRPFWTTSYELSICDAFAIWYYFYNLKNVKNTTKSNTPTWVIFTFFKLCKWYQIAQSITYMTPNSLTWKRIGSISELSFIWIFCTEYNKI